MRESLDTIAGLLTGGLADAQSVDWSAVRYQHAQAVRSRLAETYAPATVNKMLSALRGVLKEAWRLGQMSAEDYHRATDLEAVKGETLPRGRSLGMGELGALLAACEQDKSPAGARDAALLALLYGGGLRRSEAVAIDVSDYEPDTGMLTIKSGKGRKDRTVYATNGAATALTDWLDVRGPAPGALFNPVNKGGKVKDSPLTGQAVLNVLAKRAKQAGVPHVSPHDLRRTFVSHLLDAGADIVTVQKLAGHSQVTTTARYDRRGEAEKKKAAELLFVPYGGRR
jgi:integrase